MLATFIIGLREGLEAALIVGIVAAFLVKNGRRLTPMWIGVGAAVVVSLLVGTTLALVEQALPQAAQEGMESIIGAVAVFFVTGMILWMGSHSRGLKKELEASAQEALSDGASTALVVMAFLAVLKEGFETAVFLLATFQASTSAVAAATGALLGILVAVGLGIGIYRGGVRINLSKFFRATGVFLVLVAAGLVVTTLRTAHEAGWLNAGQQRTVDLSWLAPVGSVRGALFTGVLGIPADPRLIEVVGWFCYLIPMMLIVLWPPAKRPSAATAVWIRRGVAAGCLLVAGILALVIPQPSLTVFTNAPIGSGGTALGDVRLEGTTLHTTIGTSQSAIPLTPGPSTVHVGLAAVELSAADADPAQGLPAQVTLQDLVTLNGGRVPVGIDVQRNPGPYDAAWTGSSKVTAWTVDGVLLDATSQASLVLSLSGGGLPTARTLTVSPGATLPGGAIAPTSWTVDTTCVDVTSHTIRTYDNAQTEARFWGRIFPLVLVGVAILLLVVAEVRRRKLPPSPPGSGSPTSDAGATERRSDHPADPRSSSAHAR